MQENRQKNCKYNAYYILKNLTLKYMKLQKMPYNILHIINNKKR